MNTKNLSTYYKKFTLAKNNAFNFETPNVSMPKSENLKNFTNNKTAVLISIIVLLFAAFMLGRILPGGNTGQISAPKPQATQTLNKEFKFPLRDNTGKKVSDISYTIQTANLQDSFIYQGKDLK